MRMIALGCIAIFVLCVLFWGSLAMLGMQNWSFFGMGMAALVGVLVLIWLAAFVYWTASLLKSRKEIRLKIKTADDAQDIGEKERFESELKEENWGTVLLAASLVWFIIAVYGIGAPIWLLTLSGSWLLEKIRNFSKEVMA